MFNLPYTYLILCTEGFALTGSSRYVGLINVTKAVAKAVVFPGSNEKKKTFQIWILEP